MGDYANNEERPFRVQSCEAVIDREVGQPANRYVVAVDRPMGGFSAIISKSAYHELVEAAQNGSSDFSTAAAATIPFWAAMSTGERDFMFAVFLGGPAVQRCVRQHRGSPPLSNQGPWISGPQSAALVAQAQQSHGAFASAAAAALGPWWSALAAVDQDHFYFNFRDT